MYNIASIFISVSIIAIIWQLVSDFKELKIDERKNWVVQGILIGLVLVSGNFILYFITLILVNYLFNFLKKLEKKTGIAFADGDKQIISWIIPGFTIIGPLYSGIFCIWLATCLLLTAIAGKIGFKTKFPGLILITLSFALTISQYLHIF